MCGHLQAEAALIENDSIVIDAIVQHLASRNDKARQAAIFAISRISSFQVGRTRGRGTYILRVYLQHCSCMLTGVSRLHGNRGALSLHGIFCGCWSTQTPRFARLRRLPWYMNPAERYFPSHAHPLAPHRPCMRFWQGHVITKGEHAAQNVMDDIEALLRHDDRNVREAAVDAVVQVRLRYQLAFCVRLLT